LAAARSRDLDKRANLLAGAPSAAFNKRGRAQLAADILLTLLCSLMTRTAHWRPSPGSCAGIV